MTNQEMAKIREEVRAELLKEAEKQKQSAKRNKNTFNHVLSEFEDDFKKFDWRDDRLITRSWDGTSYIQKNAYCEAYKVKSALSALAKAAFKAKSSATIPSEKEEELRLMVHELLNVVLNKRVESAIQISPRQ